MPNSGQSILDRLSDPVWPEPDDISQTLVVRQDSQLYRTFMWVEFKNLLAKAFGNADRSHMALSDKDAFPLIMEVIWTGKSHNEVAEGKCPVQDLIERHQEYAQTRVLPTFLLTYPAFHYRVSKLVIESSVTAERVKLKRKGKSRGGA